MKTFNLWKFKSILFTYQNDGTVSKKYINPYGSDILDGIFVTGKFPLYCEYRNESYQIEKINIQQSQNGEIYTMLYYYNPDLFVKYYYYKEFLISGLELLEGDKLVFSHKVSYGIRN